MGYNYGKRRNRLEGLPALRPIIYASIGEDNINFEKSDFQQIADETNASLDKAQDRYDEKYNFPKKKHPVRG